VGLLDYYRQFEGMSEEEVNARLREDAAERKRKALTRVETLDLSQTTWHELPHPRIVNAITFVARRGLHRYPHVHGADLRNELAERHGVEPERLILGNGAAELLSSATRALIAPGQLLLTVWPSYPLFPLMARRAHGQAVRVSGGVDELLEAAREPDVRVIALASPNDPTGELLAVAELERLLEGLPDGVAVLLDESLVEFADAQPTNASLELLAEHPRLLVFRSFSKAWGLAGLRIGYAIGAPGSGDVLADVTAELRSRGFEVADSQANFLWAAHPALDGAELAARLARAGVLVAAGDALGEPRHVRVGLRSRAASDRLLDAIDKAL
jgi:histidinol-phosphate aminotransferase